MIAKPKTILIVEDSPIQAELLRRELANAGYGVILAGNGAEGLAMARANRPDAVVSDINMPVMDGYAMCHAMRQERALRNTPVILLTMLSDPEDVVRGLEAGADGYLTKPYNVPSLISRIESLLTDPPPPPPEAERRKVQIRLAGETHTVDAHGPRILNLLVSTYENAVLQNRELAATQQALEDLNQHLEKKVLEKTAAIAASETRYRGLFEAARDGILILDVQSAQIVDVNPFMIELLGYTREQYLGRKLWEIGPFKDTAAAKAAFDELRKKKYVRYEGLPLRTADGRDIDVEFVSHVYRVDGGEVIQCNIRDITDRRRAEQAVRELNASLERRVAERTQQLEEANRAKSDFLANMSHELRTPLNAIIGFSEMLKDGLLGEIGPKQREFVADIFGAGTHLLLLINDILDLSKVEAGMMRLEPEALDVLALLKASTLIVKEKAAAHRVRLETEIEPALAPLLADGRKLKQIVYNLLSNAVKFTPDGGAVTLRARRCARAGVVLEGPMPARLLPLAPGEGGEFLEISVSDTGVGIAEEHLPRLFEPFVQVDSSATRRAGGTGLGLSMVRRLAELHGGTVGVASRPGVGSRFSVWLPYRAPAGEPALVKPAGAAVPAAAPGKPLALVIEDDDRTAELIAAQLRAEGFETMRAATAEEGLVRAAKRRPQLITLDIFLPEMDGWEFMRRLKADPKLADTPVVIITISEDLERGVTLGARRVLQKPFVREQLIEALAGLIEQRPNGEPARVLVVDDNPKAVELVATALEAEGYRVIRAYGGAEAIEVARRARPNLVILDLMMPEVSGFEVAKTLRASEDTARIPILVLTAKDLTAEERARLNGDVTAILEKSSFNRSELLAELRRALPKRGGD